MDDGGTWLPVKRQPKPGTTIDSIGRPSDLMDALPRSCFKSASLKNIVFRVCILAGAFAYVATLGRLAAGEWVARSPTIENVRRGLRWNPANHVLWRNYGVNELSAAEGPDLNAAIDAYGRAL